MSLKLIFRKLCKKISNEFLDIIISCINLKVLCARKTEQLINIITKNHEDKLLKSFSKQQMLNVFERLWNENKMDVISIINSEPDAGFRYCTHDKIKVVLGAGPQKFAGWISTDIEHLNIVNEISWQRLFFPGSIDRLLAEHVLEHLSLAEIKQALHHVYKYLKPKGRFRLAVPDAYHPSRYYYNLVKPGGIETPFEHKMFLDHKIIEDIAREAGFEIELLEYFDSSGIFHNKEYNDSDGLILRCAKNNVGLNLTDPIVKESFWNSIPKYLRQQFIDHRITYTSLIIDLIKPEEK